MSICALPATRTERSHVVTLTDARASLRAQVRIQLATVRARSDAPAEATQLHKQIDMYMCGYVCVHCTMGHGRISTAGDAISLNGWQTLQTSMACTYAQMGTHRAAGVDWRVFSLREGVYVSVVAVGERPLLCLHAAFTRVGIPYVYV